MNKTFIHNLPIFNFLFLFLAFSSPVSSEETTKSPELNRNFGWSLVGLGFAILFVLFLIILFFFTSYKLLKLKSNRHSNMPMPMQGRRNLQDEMKCPIHSICTNPISLPPFFPEKNGNSPKILEAHQNWMILTANNNNNSNSGEINNNDLPPSYIELGKKENWKAKDQDLLPSYHYFRKHSTYQIYNI